MLKLSTTNATVGEEVTIKLLDPLGAAVNWVITILETALPITLERTPATVTVLVPATNVPAGTLPVHLIVTVPPILGTLGVTVTSNDGKGAGAVTTIPFGRVATPATLATLFAAWLGVIADCE